MPALAVSPLVVVSVGLLMRAEFRRDGRWSFVLKPLSTGLVILIAALAFGRTVADPRYTVLLLGGLIFPLGGDVAPLFKGNRRAFLAGLLFFLAAHLFYTAVFTSAGEFRGPNAALLAATLALGAAWAS